MLALPVRPPIAAETACVLDVGFSLRPTGLHWAVALAQALPVWLTLLHWSIVEDPEFFARDPRLLPWLTGRSGAEAQTAFARTVEAWREAREDLGFESRPDLYWHGAGRAGSIVPKDGDIGLIDRVDALAAGFDGRRARNASEADVIVDSARDALALAAGLGARHTVILAVRGPADTAEPPLLVRELAAARIAATALRDARLVDAFQRPLLAALVASGLAVALVGGGLRLTVVAVVAPRSSQLRLGREDALAWEDTPGVEDAALWDDAAAVWWELP